MIASLPMYWRAETAEAWRAFWRVLQSEAEQEGIELPGLTAPDAIGSSLRDHWLRPDLALSMTCSLPLRTALRDRVTYIGTLGFGLSCADGHYYSRIIRRQGATEPLRLAYNAADSQSGWAVTQLSGPDFAPVAFLDLIETGAHEASLLAVAEGRADIAFIDAVTWRLLERAVPEARQVVVTGNSAVTPALPLIAARGTDATPLRRALFAAVSKFDPPDPAAMGGPLSFTVLDERAYLDQPIPRPPGI